MADIDRRFLNGEVEERDAEGGGKTIVGYAAVFDSLSENLGGFREVIKRGAFDSSIAAGTSVVALWNHDTSQPLGRYPNTVKLSVDNRGLRVEMQPLDTTAWRDLRENLRAGVVSGMSFAFKTRKDSWGINEKREVIRDVHDVDLMDVSVVTTPAYPGAQVSTRALEQAKEATPVEPEPEKPTIPNELNDQRITQTFER